MLFKKTTFWKFMGIVEQIGLVVNHEYDSWSIQSSLAGLTLNNTKK
jgi:hypothetical protein